MHVYDNTIRIDSALTHWNSYTEETTRDILLKEYGNLDAVVLEALWTCGQLYSENELDVMTVFSHLSELCEDLFLPMFVDEWDIEIDDAMRATIGMENMVKDMYPVLMTFCKHLYNQGQPIPIIEYISWTLCPNPYENSAGEIWEITLCPEY